MVLDRLATYLSRSTPLLGSDWPFTTTQLNLASLGMVDASPRALYALLDAYYASNGLYQGLQRAFYESGIPVESLRALRNPTQLIVEFWPALLWPGDLPDALPVVPADTVPDGDALMAAVEQVWAWSNWAAKKQLFARWLALYGDAWVKVATPAGRPRVFLELVHPSHVTDFDEDERGYATWVRIDVPQAGRSADGTRRLFVHTEVWSKEDQLYRRWEHGQGLETELGRLGTPAETRSFREMGCEDFVPMTRTPFRDLGAKRGIGAVTLLKEVIDELNRKATNLSELLFVDNASSLFLESQSMPDRPMPPPALGEANGTEVTVNKRALWKLPAGWQLNYKIAPIDYDAALAALSADLEHVARLAPEMLYWDTAEAAGVESGTARRLRMAPAVARVEEVRGSAESDHARALAMAATIGKNLGLDGFAELGEFSAGALDLTFEPRDVIPLTEQEQSEMLMQQATAYKAFSEAGLPQTENLKRTLGMSEEEAADVALLAEQEQRAAAEQAALAASPPEPEPPALPPPSLTVITRTLQRDADGRVIGVVEEHGTQEGA